MRVWFVLMMMIWSLTCHAKWLGGDVASSLRLPDGRDVWIFGDSFFGDTRASAKFVHNSMRVDHERLEEPFKAAKGFYWPLSLFFANDELYIVMDRIHYENGGLGFAIDGVTIARIQNWRASARQWRWKPIQVISDKIVSAAAVVEKRDVYFVTSTNELMKTSLRSLRGTSLKPVLVKTNFLTRENSEVSVLKFKDRWYAVQMKRERLLELMGKKTPQNADQIVMQTAPRLEGPWSQEFVIGIPPQTNPQSPCFDPLAFAYAAKMHGSPRDITYVVNTIDPKTLKENEYYPVKREATCERLGDTHARPESPRTAPSR